MISKFTIPEELKELNSNLPVVKTEVFAVPDGYFDNLAASILTKIKGGETEAVTNELQSVSPLLAKLPRKTPFTAPEGYFNNNINTLSFLSPKDELPASLTGIGKQMPYAVPPHYFEELPQQIMANVTKPKAKVVMFGQTTWMRYAAAAIVFGIIVLGSVFYFKGNQQTIDPNKQPEEWVAKKLQNVSNKDLEEFINTMDVSAQKSEVAKTKHTKEVKQLMKDVPTSELDAFLNQLPYDLDEPVLN